ncbi:3-hydroxyacyl-CoA dehydrogenase family protein [Nocardia otitidiscaviarum]|uniref:Putative 3-hydroxyacyl-CoA dehydrogenase n=1 Tax=Nocardia otitidiscaviarum TaxID=1823 RepID=A0A060PU03_9NOCA|nr:3-hydroxyacyl-CoA dehydrogenase family protein [Nocardia otitidiscaviarum]MBF6132117.1 3-hydroxyacyl-CoA dehydrogenase family protein [Nocardia otitidiscaviarum]MBF6483247.1 3-hydroxyacyl-CoA dehydrogenase family protein [Nocardia otitidiscaviarum]BAO99122.1 putative 3-hydroxyacyl-CoA dehydrogenase [Nocardia otitidiscaviarum]
MTGVVGVLGAGTMGAGIAQCLAQAGREVIVVEPDPTAVERARRGLDEAVRLALLLGRGDRRTALDTARRVRWSDTIDEFDAVDFVIECAVERIELKEKLFADLDRVCPADTVLASITSAIPIARLAAATARPGRVLGLHFMNPAPLTDAVEVVRGAATSPDTMARATDLLTALGKRPIVVGDRPGFVLNRLLMLSIAEAAALLDAGESAATVDDLFEQCLGHRMGPLRTADLIGLDNVADTIEVLRRETGEQHYRVPPALAALVTAGHFGRKTGQGFHDYR